MEGNLVDQLIAEADALYAEGKMKEALATYKEACEQDADRAWVHNRIGAILAQQGDLQGAEQALARALELDPKLPQAHSNLGNIFYARADFEAALAKYKDAVALSPNTPIYHENLHAAYKKLGKLSDAVVALKAAHRLEREHSKAEAKERFQNVRQSVKGRMGCLSVLSLLTLAAATLVLTL